MQEKKKGTLYVVATPIGNLKDITFRALQTLSDVAAVFAEDTRKAAFLLSHFQLKKPLYALHEHNERAQVEKIMGLLAKGESLALISDAGTPLISDPGYWLIKTLLAEGYPISPIPGPSALIAALSVSGLPTHAFSFLGFLPAKKSAREKSLADYQTLPHTLIFYEAPHRLMASLASFEKILGDRPATIARELTKLHEELIHGKLSELSDFFSVHPDKVRGEFVILIEGKAQEATPDDADAERILQILLGEVSTKQAVQLTSQITGVAKNLLYKMAVQKK